MSFFHVSVGFWNNHAMLYIRSRIDTASQIDWESNLYGTGDYLIGLDRIFWVPSHDQSVVRKKL